MPLKKQKRVWLAWVCALAIPVLAGCAALEAGKENINAVDAPQSAAPKEVSPVYYDFGDVLLPGNFKMDRKESFIVNSGGMTSGMMVLKGNLDAASIIGFFESKMPVDGWRKVGRMTSAYSLLVFMKPARWCVIGVTEGQFGSRVEVWVAPTEDEKGAPSALKGNWK